MKDKWFWHGMIFVVTFGSVWLTKAMAIMFSEALYNPNNIRDDMLTSAMIVLLDCFTLGFFIRYSRVPQISGGLTVTVAVILGALFVKVVDPEMSEAWYQMDKWWIPVFIGMSIAFGAYIGKKMR